MHRSIDLKSTFVLPLALLTLSACTPRVQSGGQTVTYTCDGGQSVAVGYVGSSVAQVRWQGTTYTLNQTESGSGVRYTNGFYTWVTKGNQGFLQQTGLNQDDVIIANNCVARS